MARVQHHVPNCGISSRARNILIPGIRRPLRPLRNRQHLPGIPSAVEAMTSRERARLDGDTFILESSACDCKAALRTKRLFSLERPGNSLAHDFVSWRELEDCVCPPCMVRKFQPLATNL